MKGKKIIITGAKGTIGVIIREGLRGHQITSLDLPESDTRDYSRLLKAFPDHDVVIHLAWDTKTENWRSGKINPDNASITYNVYQAALEAKVPRVIMASSVHADEFLDWNKPELLTPSKTPFPTSPYGASKVFMEALGRYYAKKHGLEVICVRFGGVNPENTITKEMLIEDPSYGKVWFSHKDCANLIKACIEIKTLPEKFVIVYGISNNSQRIHDWTNPFKWRPQDNSEKILKRL